MYAYHPHHPTTIVAALLERRRRAEEKSLKELVNEALRRGLKSLRRPASHASRSGPRSVDVGRCLIGQS